MKQLILSILLYSLPVCFIHAQAAKDVNIGIVCPEQMENFSSSSLSRIEHKIEQIATANGVATLADGEFVIYPTFDIYETKTVESGMKNISIIKADMVLSVLQISTGLKINTISTTISGSGYNIAEAISDAISKINVNDSRYTNFIRESKERIYSYYESNCTKIIQKAKTLEAQQQFEAAIALLAYYPSSLPSYKTVSEALIDIYTKYQNSRCSKLIIQAKGYIAQKDYTSAIEVLSQIDPDSRCKEECLRLLEQISKQVDKEEKEAIERQFRVLETLADLEKHKISAAKDIAVSYYSSQPTIHYTQIVK